MAPGLDFQKVFTRPCGDQEELFEWKSPPRLAEAIVVGLARGGAERRSIVVVDHGKPGPETELL